MTWTIDGRPLGSVLISRQRYLGDIVMATTVLEALRAGDSRLRLGFLCESGHGAVLTGQEGLDVLHLLDRRRRRQDARARGPVESAPMAGAREQGRLQIRNAGGTWELVRQLRAERYDLVVDLFFNPFTAWLFWLTGIPFRFGGTPKWRRRLYTHTVVRGEEQVRGSRLAQVAPGGLGEHLCRLAPLQHAETNQPFLQWLANRYEDRMLMPRLAARRPEPAVTEALEAVGVGGNSDFLLLAPGATWPSKEWPTDHWRDAIRGLLAETDLPLVLLLPPTRSARWGLLGAEIPPGRGGALPVLPLTGALDVIGRCRCLVTVDGGTLHAGVGLQRPTLGLFGPTDPDIWFPYEGGGPFRVLAEAPECHPCDLHECDEFVCLPNLKPARVIAACLDLLRDSHDAAGGRA